MVRGDFGKSLIDDTAISRQIADTFPVTFELVLLAFLFALVVAIPLGVLSALHEGRAIDHLARIISVVGVSIPGFWLGLMLIAWGGVKLGWFPAGGYVPWRAGASTASAFASAAGDRARSLLCGDHQPHDPLVASPTSCWPTMCGSRARWASRSAGS